MDELGEVYWSGWCSEFSSQRDQDDNTDTNIAGESCVRPNNRKALKRRISSKTDDGESAGGGKLVKRAESAEIPMKSYANRSFAHLSENVLRDWQA